LAAHRYATIAFAVGALMTMALTSATGLAGQAPAPFKAEYRVKYGFFEVGRYYLRLSVSDDGAYRYTSLAEPSSFVSVLTGRQLKELSEGQWRDNAPQPSLYRRSVKKDGDWRDREVRFSEDAGHNFPPDALDPASLVLALMHDADHDRLREQYSLVDHRGKVRSYGIKDHGWSQVTAAGRDWRARKLERDGGNPEYDLTVYLAPELGWLPVRIDYTDKGRDFEMYLVEVDGRQVSAARAGEWHGS
jgi:hypothetical protein